MSNAFNYMFKDKGFVIKATIFFVLFFVTAYITIMDGKSTSLTSSLISIVIGCTIMGHFYECIGAVKKSNDTVNIPWINPATFWIGLKGLFASSIMGAIIGLVSMFTLYIPAIIVAILYPGILSVYSDFYKPSSFFNFNKAFLILKEDFGKYFLALLILIFYTTIAMTVLFFIMNGLGIQPESLQTGGPVSNNMTIAIVLITLAYTYTNYVYAYVIGDLYKLDKYDTEEEYIR